MSLCSLSTYSYIAVKQITLESKRQTTYISKTCLINLWNIMSNSHLNVIEVEP